MLIRSVLSSLPVYKMLVNVLAKGVKKKLHGMFSQFLWEAKKSELHLVNWDTVSSPVLQGGLGILDVGDMEKTLVAKWIFNKANNRDAL